MMVNAEGKHKAEKGDRECKKVATILDRMVTFGVIKKWYLKKDTKEAVGQSVRIPEGRPSK